ncbi:hypothetical protein GCM10023222_25840 [Saccharopolyspora cebuensis]
MGGATPESRGAMKRARTVRASSVTCADSFGRRVATTISVDTAGKVFLTAPPDETACFEHSGVVELVGALHAALGLARSVGQCTRAAR